MRCWDVIARDLRWSAEGLRWPGLRVVAEGLRWLEVYVTFRSAWHQVLSSSWDGGALYLYIGVFHVLGEVSVDTRFV